MRATRHRTARAATSRDASTDVTFFLGHVWIDLWGCAPFKRTSVAAAWAYRQEVARAYHESDKRVYGGYSRRFDGETD